MIKRRGLNNASQENKMGGFLINLLIMIIAALLLINGEFSSNFARYLWLFNLWITSIYIGYFMRGLKG